MGCEARAKGETQNVVPKLSNDPFSPKRKERRWCFRVAVWLGRRSCVLRSEQYRRYAQECLVLARNAEDERARASLLQMAQVWFRLAEERVSETDEKQSAES